MTKSKIIESVNNDSNLKRYCASLCGGRNIKDDMWQELVLLLCEKNEEAIVGMYLNGYLHKWCGQVLKNLNSIRIKANKSVNTKAQALREMACSHFEIKNKEVHEQGYDFANDANIEQLTKYIQSRGINPVFVLSTPRHACMVTGKSIGSVKWERSKIINELRKNFKREYIPSK